MCFYLSVLSSSKHNILILKHGCVEFISIKLPTMGKSNQKTGKTCNYPCVWKSCYTSHKGIGSHKKRVISYSKTTILTFLISWKRSRKIKVVNIFTFQSKVSSDLIIILLSPTCVRLPIKTVLVLVLFWK